MPEARSSEASDVVSGLKTGTAGLAPETDDPIYVMRQETRLGAGSDLSEE
jgi:hypothetical protein